MNTKEIIRLASALQSSKQSRGWVKSKMQEWLKSSDPTLLKCGREFCPRVLKEIDKQVDRYEKKLKEEVMRGVG